MLAISKEMSQFVDNLKKLVSENLTVSFLFVFIISTFVFGPLSERIKVHFRAKPKLIFNVTEIENLTDKGKIEHFKLLFGTQNGESVLLAAQTGDENLNKLYGAVAAPAEMIPCEGCAEYTFSLKNVGQAVARNITIDFLSLSDLEFVRSETDPKINNIQCGGMLGNKGCRLEINSLSPGGTVLFTGLSKGPGIRQVVCRIDGDDDKCLTNFRHYYIRKIEKGMTLEMNGKRIDFPPINASPSFIQYHWKPKDRKWIRDSI